MIKSMSSSFDQDSLDSYDQPIITKDIVVYSKVELDHLACPICLNVIWDPITCGSKGCYSSFCSDCISKWLRRPIHQDQQHKDSKGCPKCKRHFKPISIPLLRSLLQCLVVRCTYHSNGCNDSITYPELLSHINSCGYRKRRCEGCNRRILASQYSEHIELCQLVPVECERCELRLVREQFTQYHTQEKCYEKQIGNTGDRLERIEEEVGGIGDRYHLLEIITKRLIKGESLPLKLDFYTTFTQHFTFPNVTLIKPSFNLQKQKFDFLHFYITNPIRANGPLGVEWKMKINKLIGNLLIGFCSSMCTNSLDYVINRFGELKKKEPNESKYRPIRKTFFEFSVGDVILFKYNSHLQQLKLQNLTKNSSMKLETKEIQDIGENIYSFYSMDTLNDSISFS